jgi:hypothetical protein
MDKNSRGFVTPQSVIFVLALAVVAGGYFAFGTKIQTPVLQEQSPTSTVVEIDTVGWQNYRNKQHGFEIKYPPDFMQSESNDGIYLTNRDYISSEKEHPFISIWSQASNGLSLGQFIEKNKVHYDDFLDKSLTAHIEYLDAYKTYILTFLNGSQGDIYFSNNNKIWGISWWGNQSYKKISIDILSTFKFINERPQGKSCVSRLSHCSCSYECTEISIDPRDQLMDCQRYCSQGEINNHRPNCGYIGSVCTDLSK